MTYKLENSREIFRRKTPIKLAAAVAAITAGITAVPQVSAALLEEVLVTAQKRVQSLQDVPVSVVAMAGDTIEEQVM